MKTISLTRGAATIVSDEDYEELSKSKWHLNDKGDNKGLYAYRKQWLPDEGRYLSIAMHRLITNCPKGREVDHIDGNGLNNQRENLRVVSHTQNMSNMRRRRSNKSGYPGISFDSQTQRWRATITADKIFYNLGRYKEMSDAIKARKEAEKELHNTNK